MPTAKPRITITLSTTTHETLSRLSVVSGESMSSIVAQVVDLAVPSLGRLGVVLEQARDAPKEARAGLLSAIDRAERDLLPAMTSSIAQADMFLTDLAAAAGSAAPALAGAPVPVAAVSDPRLVTRGSGTGKTLRARAASRPKAGGRRG